MSTLNITITGQTEQQREHAALVIEDAFGAKGYNNVAVIDHVGKFIGQNIINNPEDRQPTLLAAIRATDPAFLEEPVVIYSIPVADEKEMSREDVQLVSEQPIRAFASQENTGAYNYTNITISNHGDCAARDAAVNFLDDFREYNNRDYGVKPIGDALLNNDE